MASSKKRHPGNLLSQLDAFLKQHTRPGQKLLLGLSGGLDSSVLLHLLAQARSTHAFELQAVHVNHGISLYAPEWARFCADLCDTYKVPLTIQCVDVPRDSGLGLEAAARNARYQAFETCACDAIVLAHHRDDQAETMLLQLLRGAGVKGLSGMAEALAMQILQRPVLRPLLDIPRAALESYAAEHQLRWIEDESNLDLAYDRNFLRRHILPELEQRYPACRTTLARSAAHIAEAARLLDEVAAADAELYGVQGRLSVSALRAMSLPRAKNVLRYWLHRQSGGLPSSKLLDEIYRQLCDADEDAQMCVPFLNGEVRRYRDQAWFVPQGLSSMERLRWQGEETIDLPAGRLTVERTVGRGVALAKIKAAEAWIGPPPEGGSFKPHVKRPMRTLRHLFQEAGIPPWQRPVWPCLYLDHHLACVAQIGVAPEFQAMDGEEGMLLHWQL
jgi:tRNA(Ile)-lysidine synthase